nr:alpha/beta hydrolase-fold protein [Allomuricauda sp.]
MKSIAKIITFLTFVFLPGCARTQIAPPEADVREFQRLENAKEPYELGEDSKSKDGVPRGTLNKHVWKSDRIYPGTTRDYWIYVPKQYDLSKPASLIIFLDGDVYLDLSEWSPGINPTNILDNLIDKGEIPVTIGLFIMPGDVGPGTPYHGGTSNRSFEYDSTTDLYGRFLLEELIPEIKKEYNITDDPAGRILVGFSSGGLCAFNVAWHRPDKFGNVISHCGSFTNMRGGHEYPSLIRRTPKKEIRIFLQSGSQDLNAIWGDWALANKAMASGLKYAGYDYQFVFGEGSHSLRHGGQLFPDTLKWIWRDYPKIK